MLRRRRASLIGPVHLGGFWLRFPYLYIGSGHVAVLCQRRDPNEYRAANGSGTT
jgi:hypothetical protein